MGGLGWASGAFLSLLIDFRLILYLVLDGFMWFNRGFRWFYVVLRWFYRWFVAFLVIFHDGKDGWASKETGASKVMSDESLLAGVLLKTIAKVDKTIYTIMPNKDNK